MQKAVSFLFTVLISSFIYCQHELRVGVGGHVPVGYMAEFATFTNTADVAYLKQVSDKLKLGPSIGFQYAYGAEVQTIAGPRKAFDSKYLIIGFKGYYELFNRLWLGAETGYAKNLRQGSADGLYYSIMVGYEATKELDVIASFRGIKSNGFNTHTVGLGANLKIK